MPGTATHSPKNLLVTGRPGCGKTTVVESVLRRFAHEAGGFLTREMRERGVRKGFEILTVDGKTAVLASTDTASRVRVGKYGVDIAALENVAVTAVREALERKAIVVIDEIGRMELASEQFRRAVLDALASDRVVLAAIHAHPHPFTDAVKARADVRIFQVTAENRSTLPSVLGNLVSGLLRQR